MNFKKYIKIFFSILLGVLLLELGLRITGTFKVYSEKVSGRYYSYFDYSHIGHYKTLPKSTQSEYRQPEFNIKIKTNSWGMRNNEISLIPSDTTFRILCLGDSYTEGDGANNGFEYPRQLEKSLNNSFDKRNYVEVINGGKNGSDIIYLEKIFTEQYSKLRPHLVLVAINYTDIEDIIQRGGVERFRQNNTTKFKKGPSYHKYYQNFHVFRMFVHIILQKDFLFLNKKERKIESLKALRIIEKSMERLNSFCLDNNMEIVFIIHPLPNQYLQKGMLKTPNFISENCTQNILHELTQISEFPVYDICVSLSEILGNMEYNTYAWPINGHFNDFGYQIFTEEIYKVVKNHVPLVVEDN